MIHACRKLDIGVHSLIEYTDDVRSRGKSMKIKKVVIAISVASFPMMLLFQNCAKQGAAPTNTNPVAFNTINSSADVPPGEDFKYDQVADPAEVAQNPDGVRVQILDPLAERLADIEEAKADCALAMAEAPPEGVVKSATESVKGFRGKVVLAARDFGGNTSIDTISDSYGKIYICGLTVNGIANTGGRLVMIDSTVINQIAHHGTIDLIHSEINALSLSGGIIHIHDQPPVSAAGALAALKEGNNISKEGNNLPLLKEGNN